MDPTFHKSNNLLCKSYRYRWSLTVSKSILIPGRPWYWIKPSHGSSFKQELLQKGFSLWAEFWKIVVSSPSLLKSKLVPEGLWYKNEITNACSTADCCQLLAICPRCCPRHAPDDVIIHCGYHRLPLDGTVIGTFEYCSVCSDWTTIVL